VSLWQSDAHRPPVLRGKCPLQLVVKISPYVTAKTEDTTPHTH